MSGTSPVTIGQALRQSEPDQGVLQDFDLFNTIRDEAALLLTGSTSPVLTLTSDYLMAVWAASNSDAMYAKWRIPRSAAYKVSKRYNDANRTNLPFLNFSLNLALRMGGSADTPRVTVTAILRAADGAQKGTFTPTSIDADGTLLTDGTGKALANGTNPALVTYNFFEVYASGPLYAAPGDTVDFKIVPGTHTTASNTVELHQAFVSCAVNPAYTARGLVRE